jgi:hypothetical protein
MTRLGTGDIIKRSYSIKPSLLDQAVIATGGEALRAIIRITQGVTVRNICSSILI